MFARPRLARLALFLLLLPAAVCGQIAFREDDGAGAQVRADGQATASSLRVISGGTMPEQDGSATIGGLKRRLTRCVVMPPTATIW
jgi:hypothetical protein